MFYRFVIVMLKKSFRTDFAMQIRNGVEIVDLNFVVLFRFVIPIRMKCSSEEEELPFVVAITVFKRIIC